MKISLRDRLEYVGYRLIEGLAIYLPRRGLVSYAKILAILVYKIFKIRKDVALENLRQAFPEKNDQTLERIAFHSYFHFLLLILEFWKLWRLTPRQITKIVDLVSDSVVEKILNDKKGIIIASAHFGNWEFGAAYLTRFWKPFYVIQKRQKNRLVDARMAALRRRWGMEIIYSRGAVRHSVRVLSRGHALALLGDQDAGRKGVFVPFFGRLASTPAGAAILHLKTGVPLVFGAVIRIAPFRYRLELVPIPYNGEMIVNKENVWQVTSSITKIAEEYIRKFPDQYFWVHKRWKTAPPVAPS